MPHFADEICDTLRSHPGMSDRELMDHLRGRDKKQNQAHQECRILEGRGHLVRKRREDGRIGNFLAGSETPGISQGSQRHASTPPVATNKTQPVSRSDSQSVFLVSCVSRKRQSPAPAKDLYLSDFFVKARRFVESREGRWFILSARHGLLSPDEIVAPYERTLNSMGVADRRAWAERVLKQIDERIPEAERVIFLAGQRYREHLIKPLADRGIGVEVPMQGLKIGEQLSWLGQHAEP